MQSMFSLNDTYIIYYVDSLTKPTLSWDSNEKEFLKIKYRQLTGPDCSDTKADYREVESANNIGHINPESF